MVRSWKYTGTWNDAKTLHQRSCLEVPWYIPSALSSLGESFILYLFSDNPISKHFTTVIDNFLVRENHQNNLIVAVNVKSEEILNYFSVSILPQLRIFYVGKEISRHHGTKSYDELYKLLVS